MIPPGDPKGPVAPRGVGAAGTRAPAALGRARRNRWVRRLFRLHGLLGICASALLLVIALSGATLVFRHQLDRALFPALHRVAPRPTPPRYDDRFEEARRRHPQAHTVRVRRFPQAADESLELAIGWRDGADDRWLYEHVDPYDGRVLGAREAGGRGGLGNPMDTLVWFHLGLLAGAAGELVVTLLGIAFFGSLVTGAFVYRRSILRVLTFRVSLRPRGRPPGASYLHRVVGVWALVFNTGMAVTGIWMHRHVFTSPRVPTAQPPPQQPALPFSLDRLLAEVQRREPRFVPRGTTRLGGGGEAALIGDDRARSFLLGEHASRVTFDAATGEMRAIALIGDAPAALKLDAAVMPLHFGRWGGTATQLLYVLGGLTPAFLSLTGTILWWRRHVERKPRRARAAASGSPPRRAPAPAADALPARRAARASVPPDAL